jgi:hypothetical protein
MYSMCVCVLSDRNFFPALAPRVFQSPLHEPMTVLMRNEHRALAAVVSALSKSLVPLGAACAHQSFFESVLIPARTAFFPLFPSAAPVLIIVFVKVRDLIIYSAASRHLADELLGQRGGFFLEKKRDSSEAAAVAAAAAASDLPFCCSALWQCVFVVFSVPEPRGGVVAASLPLL